MRSISIGASGIGSQIPVGVQDLVERGYFIPEGGSHRESGSGIRCRTLSDLDWGQSPVMSHRDGF